MFGLEYKCPKCGSDNVTNRFTALTYKGDADEPTAEEVVTGKEFIRGNSDYDMHYDTKVCLDCKYWDWFTPVGW